MSIVHPTLRISDKISKSTIFKNRKENFIIKYENMETKILLSKTEVLSERKYNCV